MTPQRHRSGDATQGAGDRVRLHKLMARAGVGSRRACEDLIERGEVEVNGEPVIELPVWVDPEQDRVSVRGRPLPTPERNIYVMLYKPKRTVCTMHDPGGRRTVADLVDHPAAHRLYPVGRLDYDTLGLLLMTNDGDLANRLTHPRYGVHKTYRATVKGRIDDDQLAEMASGVFLAKRRDGETIGGERAAPAEIRVLNKEQTKTILEVTLREGRNRQVRRMLAKIGCPVKKLVRTGMGPIRLKGLRVGEWRELTRGEVNALRKAAREGERKSRTRAGVRAD